MRAKIGSLEQKGNITNVKKKVKQFTGKHKLDKYLTKEEIKKLDTGSRFTFEYTKSIKKW